MTAACFEPSSRILFGRISSSSVGIERGGSSGVGISGCRPDVESGRKTLGRADRGHSGYCLGLVERHNPKPLVRRHEPCSDPPPQEPKMDRD